MKLRSFWVVAAILAVIAGQVLLARHSFLLAVVLYGVALVFWSLALMMGSAVPPLAKFHQQALPFARVRLHPIQFFLVPISLGLAALTFLTSTDNSFTVLNATLWLLSILTFLLAFGEVKLASPRRPAWWARTPRQGILISWRTWVLLAVLAFGAFFYYYQLDLVPAEMTSDHAEKLLDINDVLNGARPIFFIRNTGREPLEFYLVASFITLTEHPLDYMALKWITATIGFLVVPLTFLLGRNLFGSLVGWLAAAFVGMSEWAVGIARMGLRFPFTPFFTALTFILLFRAFQTQRRNDYLLTGLALGAGLYGYHAFKIVPLAVAVCFGLWLLLEGKVSAIWRGRANWPELRRYALNVTLVIVLSFIVFMPLLRFMTDHPENFWYRVLTRVSNEERPLPGNPALILADNMKTALLMFNVEGDRSWPNTLSEVPVLDEVSGGLLVLGTAYALYRLVLHRETIYAYLLAAGVIMMLPSALSIAFPIENPSVIRAGGAIPFVFLLLALPLAQVALGLKTAFGKWGAAVAGCALIAIVLLSAQLNYTRYFVQFDEQYRDNSWNSSEIAATMLDFARSGGSLDHAWVIAYPYWVDTRNVAINLGNIKWDNVLWHVNEIPDPSRDPAPRLYILDPRDVPNQMGLRGIFPDGIMRVYTSRTPGKEYLAFYVPGKNELR